jgi:hypothetical protein
VCVLVALGVKNAFTTLRVERILEEPRRKRLPGRLQELIRDYLIDRSIVVHSRRSVCAGVPLLWNLVYDGVLETLNWEKNLEAVAFADDLAILLKVRESSGIEDRIRAVISMTTK